MLATTIQETQADLTKAGSTAGSRAGVVLWIVQGLLVALFLFAGGVKLVMPIELMTAQMPLPGPFLRFVGVCEVLGALGLILPGLSRIRPGLTPVAAVELVHVMIGATVLTLITADVPSALVPMMVGLLASFVAYGRWRLAPQQARTAEPRGSQRPAAHPSWEPASYPSYPAALQPAR